MTERRAAGQSLIAGLMRAKFAPALTTVVLLAAALFAACGGEERQDEPQAAGEPLKIGYLADYSGPIAEFGPALETAARLAVKHLNGGGGVLGRDVELVTGDTTLDPARVVEEARRLVEVEGVHAIVAALPTAQVLALVESVAAPAGVPTISPTATSPQLTFAEDDDLLFRSTVSDAAQGPVLAQLAADEGYANVGLLYINDPYGQGLSQAFLDAWDGRASAVPIADGASSYLSELLLAAEGGAEALIAIAYPSEAEIFLREAIEHGLFERFLFVDATKSPDLIEAIGAERLEGMKGTAPTGDPASNSLRMFDRAYRAEYGELPRLAFVRETYDAVIAIGLAAVAAGSTEGGRIRDQLRAVGGADGIVVEAGAGGVEDGLRALGRGEAVNYEGAAGTLDWDAAGDLRTGFIGVWRYADGGIEELSVQPVTLRNEAR